jgi:ATP-dependent RNA helicase DeaD
VRYRLAVGHAHGVKPGNIVGAIANEAGLDSKRIGRVDIRDDHSLVDLPAGMPDEILQHLQKVWVVGQQLRMVEDGKPFAAPRKPGKLAIDDDQSRTRKPRTDKVRAFRPGTGKPAFNKSRPPKGPGHAFPPRKPVAKAGAGKGKPRT